MLPNYLVIGAPRCGTSWLARNLRTHPQVFLPELKEVHFFDRNYEKGISWYEKFFAESTEVAVGEATPGYLYGGKYPELIHQVLPHVKLIVSLRDPTERAYSHYWYRATDNKVKREIVPFEHQLTTNPQLIEEGLYGVNLQRYYNLFPKNNILVLRYEDIQLNPGGYMSSIFRFLDVDDSFAPPYLTKVVNSSATRSGSKAIHSISSKLSKLRFDYISNMLDKAIGRDIPSISKEVRKKLLKEYFLNDINKLEKLIGQDLTQWKQ